MRLRCIYALVLAVILKGVLQGQNPVQIENSLSGTPGWQLSNPAVNREIEGYASLTSVNIGGTIAFSVSTTDSTFNIEIFRTGWYAGAGARLQTTISNLRGVLRTTPTQDPVTKLIECAWPSSYNLTVPATWVSGVYLARLTGNPSGRQSWIIFIVRDDNRSSALLFENSVTTYQAYNFWPNGANGRSLYGWGNTSDGLPAWKVSFNRPYVLGRSYSGTTPGASSGVGAGEYLTNLQPGLAQNYPIFNAGYEYNMVRWLEKNGYDVTYLTDIDVHENSALLKNHRALLSVGHNEYWSMPMVQNVQNALANGLNLAFFPQIPLIGKSDLSRRRTERPIAPWLATNTMRRQTIRSITRMPARIGHNAGDRIDDAYWVSDGPTKQSDFKCEVHWPYPRVNAGEDIEKSSPGTISRRE